MEIAWRTSSRSGSGGGNCVEVGEVGVSWNAEDTTSA